MYGVVVVAIVLLVMYIHRERTATPDEKARGFAWWVNPSIDFPNHGTDLETWVLEETKEQRHQELLAAVAPVTDWERAKIDRLREQGRGAPWHPRS